MDVVLNLQIPLDKSFVRIHHHYQIIMVIHQHMNQPNVVWTNDLFGNLPSAEQILNKGYTGVSIDIEGYHPEDNNTPPIQLKNKLREWKSANLDTIITVPGNGVNSKFGGMEWFSFLAEDPNLDFICVMYYAKINDTEKKGAGELITY